VKKIANEFHETTETPFTVECPAHRHKNKSKAAYDMFGPEHENAGFANLDISYVAGSRQAYIE
jgi:hypothetical protein